MAEPTRPDPPAAKVVERDVLLATKLHVPRPRPQFLSRPRLLQRLAEGTARELTVVCAPAGFGKTTLLGDWARSSQRSVAWLSLDEGDNDPARFWRYVAAALDQARAGIGERVAALLRGPEPASLEAVVTVVVNELAGLPDEVTLVLDDYHLVEAAPVHHTLEVLLERGPPQLRLVLASRADPPLPLARLRAGGQLVELRASDLRFTAEETTALLQEVVELELPAASLAALVARTEGWAAGLQLAALSLRGETDRAGFVASFSGSHRYVLDYLTEEVLARQPEPLVRFLLETSVLERLSGTLCDAVTGRSDSQQLLEQIERANLFLVPLDEVRGWWRYHQLFAELLQARLQQRQPDRVPQLHRTAAAWFEERGLADDAVRHALAAGDTTWAARLVERHVDALLLRSEGATLQRWLAGLPAKLVGARPRLLLAQATLARLSGQVEAVEGLLDAAEGTAASAAAVAEEPYEPSVGRDASLLANVPAAVALGRAGLAELSGDADRAVAFASQALAELGEGEWMLGSITRVRLAMAEWLRGRLAEAEAAFAASIQQWRAAGEPTLAARGCHHLALVERAQGRLDAALGTYQQALEIAAPPGRPALPAAGVAYVGMAEVAYQRGELGAALQQVSQGIVLCRQFVYTPPLAMGLAALAWIRQATGDQAGALEAMGEAERVAPSPGVASLLNPVRTQRARLLLAQGDIAAAARWTQQRGLRADDEPSYQRELEYLVLARVLLGEQHPATALRLLARLHAAAVAQQRLGSVLEVRALQALALQEVGDQAGALAALAEALRLAWPEGYVRVFVDQGAPMAGLLHKLAKAPTTGQTAAAAHLPGPYLDRLLHAFEQAGLPVLPRPRRGGAAVPGLVMPLTGRELEVLGLLADGKPNQAIAEELVVSLDTVKSHVTHILDKLSVDNRTEAVTRARQLRLLR
jgi:LuxR family transcriptional regulator, maltose regulon positive regulatory protein